MSNEVEFSTQKDSPSANNLYFYWPHLCVAIVVTRAIPLLPSPMPISSPLLLLPQLDLRGSLYQLHLSAWVTLEDEKMRRRRDGEIKLGILLLRYAGICSFSFSFFFFQLFSLYLLLLTRLVIKSFVCLSSWDFLVILLSQS